MSPQVGVTDCQGASSSISAERSAARSSECGGRLVRLRSEGQARVRTSRALVPRPAEAGPRTVDRRARRGQRHRRVGGGGLPAGLHARGLRVHRGLRAPRGRVRERPRLAELGHDRVRSGGRHHRPGRAPAGRGPAGRGCRHRAGDGGGEPVRPGRGAPHLHAGRGPGHDRRRHRLPARGRRLRRGERGERAHPRARRRARRRAGGGRRLPVRRARGAEVRAVRPGLRHRHPHRCARCGRRGAAPGSG